MQGFEHITHWGIDQDGVLYHERHEKSHTVPNLWDGHVAYLETFVPELYAADCVRREPDDRNYDSIYKHRPGLRDTNFVNTFFRYIRDHGTIQTALRNKHEINPDHYIEEVHRFDISAIPTCPLTVEGISLLPGTRLVATNAPRDFSGRMQAHLGVAPHIHGTFGTEDAGHAWKPSAVYYEALFAKYGPVPGVPLNPRAFCMVENTAPNLKTVHEMGATTVHIHGDNAPVVAPYIDYSFPSFNDFLRHVTGPSMARGYGVVPAARLVRRLTP